MASSADDLRALTRGVRDVTLDVDNYDSQALAELMEALKALQLAAATASSSLLRLSDELVMLVFCHCTPNALAQMACTCSTLRPMVHRAVEGVALRAFEHSLHGRYAAEVLRMHAHIRVLRSLDAARDVAETWAVQGSLTRGTPGQWPGTYDGLAGALMVTPDKDLGMVIKHAFSVEDTRVPRIFLDSYCNIGRDCRTIFLVAALTRLLETSSGAQYPRAIVEALMQLGRAGGASLTRWALSADNELVVIGLFNLFDSIAGPISLAAFDLRDDDDEGDAITLQGGWYNLTWPSVFCFTQCVRAVQALHDETVREQHCLVYALVLLHDAVTPRGGLEGSTLEFYYVTMRVLLESDVHRANEQLMIEALKNFHEGVPSLRPAEAELAGWIRLIVAIMRLHPEVPGEHDDIGQMETVVWQGACAIHELADQALWGRMLYDASGRRHSHVASVDTVVPEAVQAIAELALPTLSYGCGPFSGEESMVAFAAKAIRYLAVSPAAAGCNGLPAALVRLLDKFPPASAEVSHESDELRERSDQLCSLALEALCSLALTNGTAVVAAGANRIAMKLLSFPHLTCAWEWAVCLMSILFSDGLPEETWSEGKHVREACFLRCVVRS